jgi:hypothetical protein
MERTYHAPVILFDLPGKNASLRMTVKVQLVELELFSV